MRSSGPTKRRPTRSASSAFPERRPTRAAASARCAISSNGGDVPLMAKAERKSTVHRRVPLDLVVVPIREKRQGHRNRRPCRPVDQRGADPSARGGAGAAAPPRAARRGFRLRSRRAIRARRCATAVASLPRDLLVNLSVDAVRDLVMMAMSLADRPRPALAAGAKHPQRAFVRASSGCRARN